MHAVCTEYEPRLLWFRNFCMAVILSGKQQNDDTKRAYSVSCSSKTPDANMLSPYGDTLLARVLMNTYPCAELGAKHDYSCITATRTLLWRCANSSNEIHNFTSCFIFQQ